MSEVIEDLTRPMMAESALQAAYREISLDTEGEREATEWVEGLIGDSLPGGDHVPR